METVTDFIFLGSKITVDGDCSLETQKCLLLGRKAMTNLAADKSLQLCPTLCDPIDGSPPGSAIPGIFQVRTLEWVAISLSNSWKWKVKGKSLSHVRLFTTPWTAAHQAPPSMGFSRQEYTESAAKIQQWPTSYMSEEAFEGTPPAEPDSWVLTTPRTRTETI